MKSRKMTSEEKFAIVILGLKGEKSVPEIGRDMVVDGWVKVSLIDFPGSICSTLFFSGCNLRCRYCHNPQMAWGEV